MAFTFDNARWDQSRRDRLQRVEIQQAKRDVEAGRARRICKPGAWVVYWTGLRVAAEVF